MSMRLLQSEASKDIRRTRTLSVHCGNAVNAHTRELCCSLVHPSAANCSPFCCKYFIQTRATSSSTCRCRQRRATSQKASGQPARPPSGVSQKTVDDSIVPSEPDHDLPFKLSRSILAIACSSKDGGSVVAHCLAVWRAGSF